MPSEKYKTIEIKVDKDSSPEITSLAYLCNKMGYQVCLNPFYKMEQSDWVILRLLCIDREITNDDWLSAKYLESKYGKKVVLDCVDELKKENERLRNS